MCIGKGEGFAIFHAGVRPRQSDAHILHDGCGVVMGKLFQRREGGPYPPVAGHVSETESIAIVNGFGTALASNYWGRYVAVLHNRRAGTSFVFRDPSGHLPCFTTSCLGVRLVFSDMEDCAGLGLQTYTVNWDYVSAVVAFSTPQIQQTGLNDVEEIRPSECVEIRGESLTRRVLWDPIELARLKRSQTATEAIDLARETIRSCVHAWVSGYDSVCHSLSGGLDSSVVLACLRDAPSRPAITCFHHYFPDLQSDERPFARQMAASADIELIEHLVEPAAVRLEELQKVSKAARPWFYLYDLIHSEFEFSLAEDKGAPAIFTGNGGDSVFGEGHAAFAVADFIHRHGFRPAVASVARDAAAVMRASAWSVLAQGLRAGLTRSRWSYFQVSSLEHTFASPELITWAAEHENYWVPTLRAANDLPHGKRSHIAGLSVPMNFYHSIHRKSEPESVHPLLSQPVVEIALAMPVDLLIAGGIDRAIERRAFERELPRGILCREAKGTANQYIKDVLETHIDFTEAFLVDGVLCQRGMLSRQKLLQYFRGPRDGIEHNEIIGTRISTEAWARRWTQLEAHAMAAA